MVNKRKKQTDSTKVAGGALQAGALAEQARGLLTGRTDVSKLIKVISLLGKDKKKAKGGIVKKNKGGLMVKPKAAKRGY